MEEVADGGDVEPIHSTPSPAPKPGRRRMRGPRGRSTAIDTSIAAEMFDVEPGGSAYGAAANDALAMQVPGRYTVGDRGTGRESGSGTGGGSQEQRRPFFRLGRGRQGATSRALAESSAPLRGAVGRAADDSRSLVTAPTGGSPGATSVLAEEVLAEEVLAEDFAIGGAELPDPEVVYGAEPSPMQEAASTTANMTLTISGMGPWGSWASVALNPFNEEEWETLLRLRLTHHRGDRAPDQAVEDHVLRESAARLAIWQSNASVPGDRA